MAATESGTVVAVTQDTIAFVNKSEGSVKRKGASGENPAASGDSLSVGDEITTGSNSRAEIIFADSSVVRLAANSVLTLKAATDTNTELELQAGEIWARILKPLTDESFFSITTSDLSAGVRGTSLRMKRVGKKTDVEVVDSTGKSAETPGVAVHEVVTLDGTEGRLRHHLVHFNYDTWAQFHAKQRHYGAMQ